jgi:hypothetical protein
VVLESWQEKTSAQGREALYVASGEKSDGTIWNTSMIFRETSMNEWGIWMNMGISHGADDGQAMVTKPTSHRSAIFLP